jgi:hypothetical protein
MKKIFYLLIFTPLLFFTGCYPDDCDHHHDFNDNDHNIIDRDTTNKVLMLKINCNDFSFDGGIEYIYNQPSNEFNIEINYDVVANNPTVRLKYQELERTLFYGTILQNGIGEMSFPDALDDAQFFDTVETEDFVFPASQLYRLENYGMFTFEYAYMLWQRVQKLVKVREYLQSNPTQKVYFYLYRPNYYNLNPETQYWLIFLKN